MLAQGINKFFVRQEKTAGEQVSRIRDLAMELADILHERDGDGGGPGQDLRFVPPGLF